jgi:hypothetical protein
MPDAVADGSDGQTVPVLSAVSTAKGIEGRRHRVSGQFAVATDRESAVGEGDQFRPSWVGFMPMTNASRT